MLEWTFTLPSELPFWELESLWTPEIFRERLQGSKPISLRSSYIIEKLLKRRCLKWARMTHLDIWNTSYGQKKDRESNWQFDSRPLKVRNQPDFLACRWRATHRWKALNKGYNFASNLISIRGFAHKVIASQSHRSPNFGNFKTPIWESQDKKAIWMWASWRGEKYIIRGKVVASPKSKPWWVLWVWGRSWFVLAPKLLQQGTNQLVVWFCAGSCEWISCLSLFLVPSRSSNMPLYPWKCY